MKIIVLGCGPAGLMAAQGASDALQSGHHQITIISRKVKSPLYGAQYLHEPIPGITLGPWRQVSYQLRGDADDYRRKVYGQMWNGTVSPEDLTESHQAWDIRATYDRLWTIWERFITPADVDPVGLRNMVGVMGDHDLVINSIPKANLCYEGHPFGATIITAAGDAPELGIRIPYSCPEDSVICNGEDSPSWYRMSRVFGRTTVEWPSGVGNVPVPTASQTSKPTSTPCDCWPSILHVGRYGRWEKGVLSHTAYFDARARVEEELAA